jgi:outer membrane protein TolC
VLVAFQQTEDLLASSRLLAREIEQQRETVASAQRFLDVASARYRIGLDPHLNVFTAQSSLLASQQTVITLRVQELVNSVQLIEALGGGWDAGQLPSEQEVSGTQP